MLSSNMIVSPLLPDGSIFPRQVTYNECYGGIGTGECIPGSQCLGIVYAGQCTTDPAGYGCCLNHNCNVAEGSGNCRDVSNTTCDGGQFFAGTGPPWPCPGPADIQCCVKYENMTNSTTSNSTVTSTSSLSIITSTSTTLSSSRHGLTKSQIGGIVGGIVGAVLVAIIVFFIFWFRRRRQKAQEGEQEHQSTSVQTAPKDGDYKDTYKSPISEAALEDKYIPISDNQMRQEMDAAVLREMEDLTTAKNTKNQHPLAVDSRVGVSELPGSIEDVVELPSF